MNTTTDSRQQRAHACPASGRRAPTAAMLMLLVLLLALVAIGAGVWQLTEAAIPRSARSCVVGGTLAFLFVLCGFYLLQPNQAAAILLFGDYKGTDRTPACAGRCPG